MREIKFRVWDKRVGKFCYPRALTFRMANFRRILDGKVNIEGMLEAGWAGYFSGDKYPRDGISPLGGDSWTHDDIVIQQYAGLKDEAGKEIYEGDLVRYMYGPFLHRPKEHVKEVTFESGGWYVGDECLFSFGEEELKVVGNVLELKGD